MLNERQKAFADYYLECGNATEAAIKAGYKPDNAGSNADKLRKNTKIAEYIDERLKAASEKRIASADEVLEFFSAVMRGEVKDQFGLETSVDTRISAGKELMKRYNAAKNSDGRVDKVAEIMAKLDEEARADAEQ